MPTTKVNGVNLHYEIRGEGPPMVLVHGFGSSAHVWEPVTAFLGPRSQVVTYDHRGHGQSDKPEGPYAIQDFAGDLLGLLNHLRPAKVDLMGHSMGGRTALLFALQHPDRLHRLLLVGASGAAPQGPPRERFESLKWIAREEGMGTVFDHDIYAFALAAAWQKEPGRAAARERFLKNTPEGFCGAADAILSMPDLTGRLEEIDVPTWVCTGEEDEGPMAFADLCERMIPRCSRAIIPGCGHYPMQDAADVFLRRLGEFLARLPA